MTKTREERLDYIRGQISVLDRGERAELRAYIEQIDAQPDPVVHELIDIAPVGLREPPYVGFCRCGARLDGWYKKDVRLAYATHVHHARLDEILDA